MKPLKLLLDRPATAVAHTLARSDVDRWSRAQKSLKRQDPGGVHDFRVALRRLRSTLRAFSPQLDDSVPRRARRRLRRLARAAGASRNLQVSREWLVARLESLSSAERVGAQWLLAGLAVRQRQTDTKLAKRVRKDFARTRRQLRRGIRAGESASRGSVKSANVVVRDALRHWTAELERRLAAVRNVGDWDDAHAARISVKRIRYLLKPFTRELVASPLVEQLSVLQDALGGLQDARVVAAEIRTAFTEVAAREAQRVCDELLPWSAIGEGDADRASLSNPAGLVTLARRLATEYEAIFVRLRREWLEEKAPLLLVQLRALESQRAPHPPTALATAPRRRRRRSRADLAMPRKRTRRHQVPAYS